MLPESSTGLYWSIRGTVLCEHHAKDIDDSRWIAEEWQPVPESSQGLQQYQCQRCSPDGTALADWSCPNAPRRIGVTVGLSKAKFDLQ